MEKNTTRKGQGFVFLIVGFLGSLAVGWIVFPALLYSEQTQPVAFSHVTHTEMAGMLCEDCHYFRDDGSYAGYPTTQQCADCHFDVLGGTEAEEKFVTEYVEPGKEVKWLTYQWQPDNVYFSHIAHEMWECTQCHPDVGTAEEPPVAQVNRLTGYTKDTMKMWRCERCHAENGISNACFVCHK
jgi:hypothetical protein